MSIIAIIGMSLTIIVSLIQFLARRGDDVRKRKEEAKTLIEEGLNENDIAKITSGFSRLKRM